ncbi:YesL family protein [Thermasporomyces composti]|jgi:uncharacterized membrane protein YesL|uniref:Putative membrane protein YesL n=1 Tax=Thermasporomyces composti TaxID=696763 RepID=A0A3D9VA66_THECX|nr:DUF624 domain-containing protein [Thermasporomyces composti]REF35895.1 putative membrane protein YesL [Thermasporomyces composti]
MTILTRLTDALLAVVFAGLLWTLASIPLVTAGPACAGLCAVMTAWDEDGPPRVWSTFWSGFGRNFRQGVWFSLLTAVAAALLSIDVLYAFRAEDAPLRVPVLTVALLGILAVSGTLVYLYPLLVRYPGPWRRTLRNAALFAAAHPLTSLAGLLLTLAAAVGVLMVPVSLPLAAGLVGWVICRLTGRVFDRFEARQASLQRAETSA